MVKGLEEGIVRGDGREEDYEGGLKDGVFLDLFRVLSSTNSEGFFFVFVLLFVF